MKLMLMSLIFLGGLSAFAGQDTESGTAPRCVNFSGVYVSSDPLDQQVWTQTDCSEIAIHGRIVGDPYLGTVDLTPVVWTVGRHNAELPQTNYDDYRFAGRSFVATYVGYAKSADGSNCVNRHVYSLDGRRNLVDHNQFTCDHRLILDTVSTLTRVRVSSEPVLH